MQSLNIKVQIYSLNLEHFNYAISLNIFADQFLLVTAMFCYHDRFCITRKYRLNIRLCRVKSTNRYYRLCEAFANRFSIIIGIHLLKSKPKRLKSTINACQFDILKLSYTYIIYMVIY